MARNYRRFLLQIAPPPWNGPWGQKALTVFGATADALWDAASWAVVQSWFKRGHELFDDQIDALGDDFNLPRYPVETNFQYLARLALAWASWQKSGGPAAIVEQLEAAGFTGAEVHYQWTPTLHADAVVTPGYWSEFWVFIPYGSHGATGGAPAWGSFFYGDGTVYGLQGLTVADIALIRGIVRKWKPTRWVCRKVFLELADSSVAKLSV